MFYNWTSRDQAELHDSGADADAGLHYGQSTPTEYIAQGKWTSTLTPSLLLEAGYNLTNHHIVYSYKDASYVTPAILFRGVRALCARHRLRQHRASGHDYRGGLHRPVSRHRRRAGTGGPAVGIERADRVAHLCLGRARPEDRIPGPLRSGPSRRAVINGDIGQQYRNGVRFAVTVLNTPISTPKSIRTTTWASSSRTPGRPSG